MSKPVSPILARPSSNGWWQSQSPLALSAQPSPPSSSNIALSNPPLFGNRSPWSRPCRPHGSQTIVSVGARTSAKVKTWRGRTLIPVERGNEVGAHGGALAVVRTVTIGAWHASAAAASIFLAAPRLVRVVRRARRASAVASRCRASIGFDPFSSPRSPISAGPTTGCSATPSLSACAMTSPRARCGENGRPDTYPPR
jgi:hypothetical protein